MRTLLNEKLKSMYNAQCIMHNYLKRKNYELKKGFTLAEVLITLAIIGVVAAITMPTLIQNYKKHVYVNQLRTTYSLLQQGFKKTLADDLVDTLEDTTLFSKLGGSGCGYDKDINGEECKNFYPELKKYFKISDIKSYDTYSVKDMNYKDTGYIWGGSSIHGIFLPNGAFLYSFWFGKHPTIVENCALVKQLGGRYCRYYGSIFVDTNGYKKGPNAYGRDLFSFIIVDDGIVPGRGKDSALMFEQTDLSTNSQYWKNNGTCSVTSTAVSNGIGCVERIIENGWVMDY